MSEQNKNKPAEEKTNEIDVYSYHTFILPFYYGKKGRVKAIDDNLLNENLPISEYLEACICSVYSHRSANVAYNVKSYFTESANKLVCSEEKIVKVYTLKEQYRPAQYIIKKSEKPEYRLDIFNIKLKLYCNGVGLLIYELENRIYKSLAAVNCINEFGRRIRAPFLNDEGQCPLVADQIDIQFKQKNASISSNFIKDKTKEENAETKNKKELDEKRLPQIVKQLIFANNKNWQIETVDDRMFVCCLVKDNNWSNIIATNQQWRNFSESEKDELYKLAYIEEDCSCQSDKMIDQAMDRTMYDRWINYGTCDFITNHSFVRLTANKAYIIDPVINPFLYQYVEFANIALLQRATIKKVQDNSTSIGFNNPAEKNNVSKISLFYSNQKIKILLNNVTSQEQGAEEFKIIRNLLDINIIEKECDDLVAALYNYYNSEWQIAANKIIIYLTAALFALTMVMAITGVISNSVVLETIRLQLGWFSDNPMNFHKLFGLAFFVVLSGTYYCVMKYIKKKVGL